MPNERRAATALTQDRPPGELPETTVSPAAAGAELHGAELHGAELHGAELHGAELHGAELHELARQPLDPQRRRHPGQWLSSIVVIGFVAWLAKTLAANRLIGWPAVGHFLFSGAILHGLLGTLELTIVAMALAIVLGFVLAALGASSNPVLVWFVRFYVWVFRGVPLIVQILAWYNLALVFPVLAVGVPFSSWHLQGSTNALITPFLASILALGLHEAAYMAEIVRAGLVAVPHGQTEAALSVGLTRRQAMRAVVLPQTLRVIVPPTGNQLVGLLKASALVSVIGGVELLTTAQRIYSVNFEVMALLIVASVWYLAVVSLLTVGQQVLERRLNRDRVGGDRSSTVRDRGIAETEPQL